MRKAFPPVAYLMGLGGFLLPLGKAWAQFDLLEPIDNCRISADNAFFDYINCLYPWVMGIAAGLCVFWGIWGGTGIILSGGDQAKYSNGMKQIQAAVIGLLILLFASTILQTINPLFFQPGIR